MSKAPSTCLYCSGTGNGPGAPCGFCTEGVPSDSQEDWDESWGKLDSLRPAMECPYCTEHGDPRLVNRDECDVCGGTGVFVFSNRKWNSDD